MAAPDIKKRISMYLKLAIGYTIIDPKKVMKKM